MKEELKEQQQIELTTILFENGPKKGDKFTIIKLKLISFIYSNGVEGGICRYEDFNKFFKLVRDDI